MKKIISFVVIATVLTATQLASQENVAIAKTTITEKKFESARKQLTQSLRSDNDGVVEAVCMIISRAKVCIPVIDVKDMQLIIDSLSTAHFSPTIRYEAYLASTIINHAKWFVAEDFLDERTPELYFLKATQKLQMKLFGLNSL